MKINNLTKKNMINIFTDGATVGFNGRLGTVKEVGLGMYIPDIQFGDCKKTEGISNNEAEFKALIWAMETAIEKGIKEARFCMDSKIIYNRAIGKRPISKKFRNERMDAFQDKVLELAKKFDYIIFRWIPREENSIADFYSKEACKI